MAIFVTVEDQEGEQIAEVFDVSRVQRHFAQAAGCCLRFVAEDVDASFNALQLPFLEEELRAVGAKELKKEERAELDRMLKHLAIARANRSRHLRFYGEGASPA